MNKLFSSFKFRFLAHKSAYIVVASALLVLTFATYYIWLNADFLFKPNYLNLPPDNFTTTKYDENGQPISNSDSNSKGTTNKKSSSKSSSNSTSSTSNSTETSNSGSSTEDAFSIAVAFYGDTQSDTDEEDTYHANAVNCILNSGANPVFHLGDLMEDGTSASLDRFNSVTSTLRSSRSFFATLGNNDRVVGDSSTPSPLWFANFSFPNNEQWYSVDYGNLHLVVLDSAFSAGSGSQLSWLTADLQSATSQNKITGVIYHHPNFSSTVHSILRDNAVDFVIAGHIHSYAKSVVDGIYYFTVSGQPSVGYLKASVYTNTVTMSAYNNSCGTIDSIKFNKR